MTQVLRRDTNEQPKQLQAGGTLNPKKHIYVERDADDKLFALLSRGEYANVLTSRQMGKSSLMMRTIHRLDGDGVRWSAVDLASELGSPPDINAYYKGLLGKFVRDLKLELDVASWWAAGKEETNNQRLLRFFRDVVGETIPERVVIFLDEIDSTLKLDYTDDLFTALRGMYNERGLVDAYGRINFCLLGVATPNELIKDRRTTAYNVGTTLELRDFRETDDLAQLSAPLNADPATAARLFVRVLHWTGGHPYLTQKLCTDTVAQNVADPAAVDRLVETAFANLDQTGSDVHFQQILRFLKERLSQEATSLKLYAGLLAGEKLRDQTTLAHAELKLSGLVKRDGDGYLRIRNPIYTRLFDKTWLKSMPSMKAAARSRQIIGGLSAALTIAVLVGAYFAYDAYRLGAPGRALVTMGVTIVNEPGIGKVFRFPGWANNELLARSLKDLKVLSRDIRSLDFSGTGAFEGWDTLQRRIFSRSQISDIGVLKDLTGLQWLNLSGTQISDIGVLRDLTELQWLYLSGTPISDIGALRGLSGLQLLDLSRSQISDIGALKDLTGLQWLDLSRSQISDMGALKGLTGLQWLNLSDTPISDIGALKDLIGLQWLYLSGTLISDIGVLKDVTRLQWLDLSRGQISDIEALKGLSRMRRLDLSDTPVSDIGALKDLIGLQWLYLSGTLISDIGVLKDLTGLQKLDLSGTLISDIGVLKGLTGLQELDLSVTPISDIGVLEGLTGLQSLDLSGTPLRDIGALKSLTGLQELDLSRSQISDIGALKGLSRLRQLDLSRTPISEKDLAALKVALPWTSIKLGG